MNILVTGSKGFVGKNLVENLKTIKNGYNTNRHDLKIDNIYEYDTDSSIDMLDEYCREADFVFHFAGVNRPQNSEEFWQGNRDFSLVLINNLKKHNNKCSVVVSSSVQATLIGRYDNEYGKSKKASEKLFFDYSQESGAKVLVYRFPNLFGKWCRPNYNSVIATFCYNIAHDIPITVNDPTATLELLYIDDLINEMFDALEGKAHYCKYEGTTAVFTDSGKYCAAPITHTVSLGEIVSILETFKKNPDTLLMCEMPDNSFTKKLFSTYLSYLPKDKIVYDLKMNVDSRGSFTELIRTANCGQFSVNITKPGIVKGEHWHNTKWELFIVVSGRGVIRQRRIGSDEILDFEVSGEKIQAVQILPGYTHNIMNLSENEDLITIMWANEVFDSTQPDTYREFV